MPTNEELARELLEAQPDRFGAVLAEAPAERRLAAAAFARRRSALVRATRATYVLHIASEGESGAGSAALAAYANLHIAGAFGHTGQLTVVVRHEGVAAAITAEAERHALGERVHVHAGDAPTVVRALNGPFDLIIAGARWREYERLGEDFARLVRIGGALSIANADTLPEALAERPDADDTLAFQRFLRTLAADERYLLSAGLDFSGVLAARIR